MTDFFVYLFLSAAPLIGSTASNSIGSTPASSVPAPASITPISVNSQAAPPPMMPAQIPGSTFLPTTGHVPVGPPPALSHQRGAHPPAPYLNSSSEPSSMTNHSSMNLRSPVVHQTPVAAAPPPLQPQPHMATATMAAPPLHPVPAAANIQPVKSKKGIKRKADTTTPLTSFETAPFYGQSMMGSESLVSSAGPTSTGRSKPSTRRESGRPIKKPSKDLPDTAQHITVKKRGKMTEQLKYCLSVVKELLSKKHTSYAWPFHKPVDAAALGLSDYHEIIKHPMDLGTVKVCS